MEADYLGLLLFDIDRAGGSEQIVYRTFRPNEPYWYLFQTKGNTKI